MFGVIVCPHCTLVLGADMQTARVTCPRCGGKVNVRKAKVYYRTESGKELAEAVRQVGERLVYDIEGPAAPDVARSPAKAPLRGEETALWTLALKMIEEVEEFSRDELRAALGDVDEDRLDRILFNLLEDGIIYEATAGIYRPA